jgi:DNA-binding response OmpR family regulator
MMPLLVDDDPAIRDLFSLFITRVGHTPCTAANGRECIGLLGSMKPDVIMLDIMMQPMDGWDTLTAIRNSPATKDLPVTMFSGKPPAPAELQQYGSWMDDYLMKPLEFRNLPAILGEIVERSSQVQEEIRILKRDEPDPARAEEYGALRRSTYLYRKYARSFRSEEYETAIRLQEERLRQLRDPLPEGQRS